MAMIASRISRETVTNAVSALLKALQVQSNQKKAQLLDTDDLLHLLISLKRIPSTSKTNPFRIPLPHPLHSLPSSTSICLFLSDHTSVTDIQSALPDANVIPLSALRTDYRPYEARRKLCDSHHLFFADRSILPLLPCLLGKTFFKKKKIPLAIDFSRADFVKQIEKACSSTLLYLRTGTSSGLKVGRVSQSVEEIVDNVVAAIEGAVGHIPRKWSNVRSIYVKSVESLALPIYQAVPDIGLKIQSGEVEEKPKKRGREVTDDETDEMVEGFIGDDGKAVEDGDMEEKAGRVKRSKKSKVGAKKKVVESSKKRGRVMDTVSGVDEGVVEKGSDDNVGGEENAGMMKKVKKSKAAVEKRVKKKFIVGKDDTVEDDVTEEKTAMDTKSKKSSVGAEKRVKKISIPTDEVIIDVKEEKTEIDKKRKKSKVGVEKRVKKSSILTKEDIIEDDVKEEKTVTEKKSKKSKVGEVGVEKRGEKNDIPVKTGKINKKEKPAQKNVKNVKSTARQCC